MTHSKKLLAAGLAALAVGAAALVFAGGATASQWHDYKGDVFAGHAYGLTVPAQAASFEVSWIGEGEGAASIALHDPTGARLAHHVLSQGLTSASVVSPVEGRYVLYVYELTGGALRVRVDAPAATALDLQELKLERTDVAVASADEPARLDKAFTTTLPATPVFVTLLYEGSARGMDAKVAGAKGAVYTVEDETGTAFAPGVWASQTGSRRLDAANLDGATYTVEVHAESFEGTLFLSTLAVQPDALVDPPAKAPRGPDATPVPNATAPAAAPEVNASPAFELLSGKAYAFDAKAGKLLVEAPQDHGQAQALSVYGPDDKLVEYVVLEGSRHNVTIALPADGEYVAYVHGSRGASLFARLVGVTAAPELRELRLVEETFDLQADPLFAMPGFGEIEIDLARAPVALLLSGGEDAMELLTDASVSNEKGVAASYSSVLRMPGGVDFGGWSAMDPTVFMAGPHAFRAQGLLGASLVLTAISFERVVEETPVEEVPEAPVEETDEAEAPATEEPSEEAAHDKETWKGIPLPPLFKVPFGLFG